MDFLDRIEKNHPRSALALTVASAHGCEVFLFKFNASLARRFGALIGASPGLAKKAVCLDLTSAKLAKRYSKVPQPEDARIFADWGEVSPDDRLIRSRLFDLASRGLALHMAAGEGIRPRFGEDFDEEQQSALEALAVAARAAHPAAIWRDELRETAWDHAEPGLSFPPLEWLEAARQAMELESVSPKRPRPAPKAARI